MEQSPGGLPLQEDPKAFSETNTGVSATASSVRLWYLVAVGRASALSEAAECRIRAKLVGLRRQCAELIARSPHLVTLVAEMVVEAKGDRRAREWFRHAQHKCTLEMILQLMAEAERSSKELHTAALATLTQSPTSSAVAHAALADRIEQLRISLGGIAELASRAIDRRSVGAALPDDLASLRDQLKQCRNELIDKHLDLVLSELRRMPRFGADKRELLQEGNLGLMRAAELFDERGDVPFAAYALSWIRAYMRRVVERHRGPPVLPEDARIKLRTLRQRGMMIDQSTGQAATIPQLAAATQMEEIEVRRLMLVRGLAFEVATTGAASQQAVLENADLEGVTALDALVELELIRTIGNALSSLNEREEQVISERYGFKEASVTSRPVIAKRLGVSAERVRQIENGALSKIAKALSDFGVSTEELQVMVLKASVA
jgi:RNA polymerase sigma factor (sigma-70 family)